MGLWGAVAGVATLVGPILGGVLVDSLGWEWIFFVNVPVGVVAFVLAWRLVPKLETHSHRFDWLGVVLSAVGMFLLVFGIQEGETYDWGIIIGPITVWGLIITGIVVLVGFVVWQRFNPAEPLLPLELFRDRNFSLSNAAITLVGFAIVAMPLPLAFYYQVARGLTPTQAALMLVPMAVVSGIMAPVRRPAHRPGRPEVDRVHRLHDHRRCRSRGLALLITPDQRALAAAHPVGASSASGCRASGRRSPRRRPATCRRRRRAPARASTTRRARSARCSAAPRSRPS